MYSFGAHIDKNYQSTWYLYGPVRNDFDAGKSIMRAICGWLTCSPSLFWALKSHERHKYHVD